MKVILYLMNAKGLAVLRALVPYKQMILGVVASRDSNVRNDYYEDIRRVAVDNGIAFYDRLDVHDKMTEDGGVRLAIGWRWLIRDTSNLVIMHDSLLPRYRGFAPLVAQLINGESVIGVTALMASECYDEGDIIGQKSISVSYPLKIFRAIELVCDLYAQLAVDIVTTIAAGRKLERHPQCEREATYSLWRDDEDYLINWSSSATEIRRFVDAVGYPYLGARTFINGKTCIVNEVEEMPDVIVEDRTAHVGKVICFKDGRPLVVCGAGILRLVSATYEDGSCIDLSRLRFRSRLSDCL